MGETSGYRVLVDRISHEVPYYRNSYLKNAVLQGTSVINNPFMWTADDKFFNYSVAQRLGVAVPKTVVLPQKGYPPDIDLTAESLHNLGYPIDWDGLLDYVGRPAILKPFSGGGWKHVYKVHDREELIAAYDGTAPYCMTLQEFIRFDKYVRCFTFGKTDIVPVAYDPHQRRYLVDHEYLSADLGARIVRDATTLNLALGYEMNTIEFAVQDGVPYAIDFLNPAPDFERDRITPHLLRDGGAEDGGPRDRPRAARLRPEHLAALGRNGGARPQRSCLADVSTANAIAAWNALLQDVDAAELCASLAGQMRARRLRFGDRVLCPFLRPFFLEADDEARVRSRRRAVVDFR